MNEVVSIPYADLSHPATQAQNRANSRVSRSSANAYKGVSFHRAIGKWQVGLTNKGERVWLGLHERIEDAIAAYNRGAREHFGEFARLTLPPLPYK